MFSVCILHTNNTTFVTLVYSASMKNINNLIVCCPFSTVKKVSSFISHIGGLHTSGKIFLAHFLLSEAFLLQKVSICLTPSSRFSMKL